MKLLIGLKNKGFEQLIKTEELYQDFLKRERQK